MKYFIVKEVGTNNPVIVGANGFSPAGLISQAPVDSEGKPYPIEALEEVDKIGPDNQVMRDSEGNPIKEWVKSDSKLAAAKAAEKTQRDKFEDDEKKARKAKKDAKDKIKVVDWAKVNTIGELKEIVRDIFESIKD